MEPEFEPAAAPYTEEFPAVLPPRLSGTERQVLYLHIEAGYRHEEVAAKLGCSPAACRMHFSRVRRHCKQLMEENSRNDLLHSTDFDKYKRQEV